MDGDGDAAGMLIPLITGDGEAAMPMPPMPGRKLASTWSGVYPVPSIQSSRTTVQSWS